MMSKIKTAAAALSLTVPPLFGAGVLAQGLNGGTFKRSIAQMRALGPKGVLERADTILAQYKKEADARRSYVRDIEFDALYAKEMAGNEAAFYAFVRFAREDAAQRPEVASVELDHASYLARQLHETFKQFQARREKEEQERQRLREEHNPKL